MRVAALGDVDAVATLAALLAVCAHLRADGRAGDGAAWAASVAHLGQAPVELDVGTGDERWLDAARRAAGDAAVARALALHDDRVARP